MTSKSKYNFLIKLLAFFKVPLLSAASPKVVQLDKKTATVYIPFKRKNKNHVGSMYFGALAMGAELSIALAAIEEINESKNGVNFIFKDFNAQFLKRGDSGVFFTCEEVCQIRELVRKSAKSAKRIDQTFKGYAYTDTKTKEPILNYTLTLSLKCSKKSLF